MIRSITDKEEKSKITRSILEQLTDWFAVPESREEYISGCRDWIYAADFEGDVPVGFICLKETGKATAEIAVMGVLKEYHGKGIGRRLVEQIKKAAKGIGYEFLQVKTVKMGMYDDYDRTNKFYLAVGFKEFEVLPIWDELNPCQIYVMALN